MEAGRERLRDRGGGRETEGELTEVEAVRERLRDRDDIGGGRERGHERQRES